MAEIGSVGDGGQLGRRAVSVAVLGEAWSRFAQRPALRLAMSAFGLDPGTQLLIRAICASRRISPEVLPGTLTAYAAARLSFWVLGENIPHRIGFWYNCGGGG